MINLDVILTDLLLQPDPALTPKELCESEEYQRRLRALLFCITGTHPKTLLMNNQKLTAVKQYALLKVKDNTQTIKTLSQLYRKIYWCRLSNHKLLKKNSNDFINTQNRLQKLNQPVDPLPLMCAFLTRLDKSYQGWKDQFFSLYISKPTRLVTKGEKTDERARSGRDYQATHRLRSRT